MKEFSLGDTVTWTSQGRGVSYEKIGRIVEIVEAGWLPNWRKFPRLTTTSIGRDHASYVVKVSSGEHYWPRVKGLRLVENPS